MSRPLRGFENPDKGNVCFLTTLLQCLFHAPFDLVAPDPSPPCDPSHNEYYKTFKQLMAHMSTNRTKTYSFAENKPLYRKLLRNSGMHLGAQNDSSEFIDFFINALGACNQVFAPLPGPQINDPIDALPSIREWLHGTTSPISVVYFQQSWCGDETPLKFTLPLIIDSTNSTYTLFAFIVNRGQDQAGHYVAYINTADKTWHEFNDQQVQEIPLLNLTTGSRNKITCAFYFRSQTKPVHKPPKQPRRLKPEYLDDTGDCDDVMYIPPLLLPPFQRNIVDVDLDSDVVDADADGIPFVPANNAAKIQRKLKSADYLSSSEKDFITALALDKLEQDKHAIQEADELAEALASVLQSEMAAQGQARNVNALSSKRKIKNTVKQRRHARSQFQKADQEVKTLQTQLQKAITNRILSKRKLELTLRN